MLLTWRSTVFLAEREVGRDLPVRLPRCDVPQHLELALREAVRDGTRDVRLRSERIDVREIRLRFEAFEGRSARTRARRTILVADRAAGDADPGKRARAARYGARSSCHRPSARRSDASAAYASSSASSISPRACAAVAAMSSVSKRIAMRSSSSAAARAAAMSPMPSMISTYAGNSFTRSSGACAVPTTRRIAAAAIPARPCLRRSNARPGCGSQP